MDLDGAASRWRENNRLEFKSAKGGLPKSFWETYSAFANTEGGIVVLGVEEIGGELRPVGLADPELLVQDLWNNLNNPSKVSANLLVEADVSIGRFNGFPVVVVRVPRADRSHRPVYINDVLNTGTFRRNGEGDYRCTMEVISSMVRDNVEGVLDKEVLADMGLDALNDDSVRGYRKEFAVLRPEHPWANLGDEEFLMRIGAVGRVGGDGVIHPTKAGLLMFGNAWRIVDAFPNFFLDCRQATEGRRWDNRVTSDSGDWSGNIYDFWGRASRMLCEDLPVPFELEKSMIRIDDTPQHKAVREALTNALVHADYYGRTGIVAVRSRDSVTISNPGCLRLPIEVIKGGGVSDPRNKTLMTMFSLLGRGDKAGSGFDVFRKAAEYAGVEDPRLEEILEPDRVKLTLHLGVQGLGFANSVTTDGGAVADGGLASARGDSLGVRESFPESSGKRGGVRENILDGSEKGSHELKRTDQLVFNLLKDRERISSSSVVELTGLSERGAQKLLKRLVTAGLIVKVGSGKNTRYELV